MTNALTADLPKRRMSKARRRRIFNLRMGICFYSGKRIDRFRDEWDVVHDDDYAVSGDDSDSNLHVALRSEHREVTATETAPRVAKVRRVRAKHRGTYTKRKSRPMPGTVRSGWKKRMNGAVERR